MSDVMLLGCLRMPRHLWGNDEFALAQIESRMQEAADRIEADRERIATLERELAERTRERDEALRGRSQTNTDLRRIAEEFKSERDGAKRDAMRAFDERNIALAERDAAIARAEALQVGLREAPCPRPANNRPDDFTVGQCCDARECGCIVGAPIIDSALAKEGER